MSTTLTVDYLRQLVEDAEKVKMPIGPPYDLCLSEKTWLRWREVELASFTDEELESAKSHKTPVIKVAGVGKVRMWVDQYAKGVTK